MTGMASATCSPADCDQRVFIFFGLSYIWPMAIEVLFALILGGYLVVTAIYI
jgi:hypothetical protein